MRHKANYPDHDAMILELADTIHHELRHGEGNVNSQELAKMRQGLDWIRKNALETKYRTPAPADPTLWMEKEIDTALDVRANEPLNQGFRKEAEREQIKARIQKDHPLFEVDLD